jgi:hypothetical protein
MHISIKGVLTIIRCLCDYINSVFSLIICKTQQELSVVEFLMLVQKLPERRRPVFSYKTGNRPTDTYLLPQTWLGYLKVTAGRIT